MYTVTATMSVFFGLAILLWYFVSEYIQTTKRPELIKELKPNEEVIKLEKQGSFLFWDLCYATIETKGSADSAFPKYRRRSLPVRKRK